jgi:hypothetical protein
LEQRLSARAEVCVAAPFGTKQHSGRGRSLCMESRHAAPLSECHALAATAGLGASMNDPRRRLQRPARDVHTLAPRTSWSSRCQLGRTLRDCALSRVARAHGRGAVLFWPQNGEAKAGQPQPSIGLQPTSASACEFRTRADARQARMPTADEPY